MKITLWIYWCTLFNKAEISSFERDISQDYWSNLVFLRIEEVEIAPVESPSDEFLRGKMILNLQTQKSEIQSDAHIKIKCIDEKINQLLCLENKGM